MKITEITYTVNQHGVLKIPQTEIAQIGLRPGDHVRVAFLSEDGDTNTFREFLLSKDGVGSVGSDGQIAVPTALLKQANIPDDADIQVICENGAIILCTDPILKADELGEIIDALGIANDMFAQLPDDPADAIELLQDTFDAEGANEYNECEQY